MKSEKITKKVVVVLTALCCLFSVLTILFSIEKSYSTSIAVDMNVAAPTERISAESCDGTFFLPLD